MRVKLRKYIKIVQGFAFKTEYYVASSQYRLVTLGNFQENNNCFKYNNDKATYYNADFPESAILKEGDLILPLTEQVVGLFGNSAFIPKENRFQFVLNQRVGKIVLLNDDIDIYYLHYLLASNSVKKQLEFRASDGTKQRNISPDDVYDVVVELPDINIQQKIGKILFDIEQKQNTNLKINSELEAMAKTLYYYWFLQFEFPNTEGKPYKSSGGKMVYNEQLKREIPEGWEVSTISNLSKLISGYPFKTEDFSNNGKYKIYTIKNVQDGFINNAADNNIGFIPKEINKECILSYGDLVMSLTGNVGRVGLVYEENALLNQRVLKIKSQDEFLNYMYLTFRENSFKEIMQRIAGGTSQKNLSPNQVGDYLVVKPNKQILNLFNEKLNGFFVSFVNNLRQNQELTCLRDFLLPLLMNGQVTFKDLNGEQTDKIIALSYIERFNQWKQLQGYAARGDVDDEVLKKIFDAMDKNEQK